MRFQIALQLGTVSILLLAILSLNSLPTSEGRVRRVVNGTVSQPGQWPFMVALHAVTYCQIGGYHFFNRFNVPWLFRKMCTRRNIFFCGGVILSSETILTAAHCLPRQITASLLGVYVGHVDRTDINDDYLYQVKQIIVHEDFQVTVDPTNGNVSDIQSDIALLRLAKPINFTTTNSKIAPIQLYESPPYIEPDQCIVIGWGETGLGSHSMHLRKTYVLYNDSIDDKIVAIDPEAKKGSCSGDSGGPYLCALADEPESYSLVGIVSNGDSNCVNGIVEHGEYTNVFSYLDWIQEHAGELPPTLTTPTPTPETSPVEPFPPSIATLNCTPPSLLLLFAIVVVCFIYIIVLYRLN